jgi:UrcA family protein
MNTRKNHGKNALKAAVAALAGAYATLTWVNSAQAADAADEPRREVVKFADLNLSSDEGAAVLYRRIHNAAVQVCGAVDSRQLGWAPAVRTCVDRAVTEALVAVNNPVVTNRYLAKTYHAALHLASAQAR